MEDNNNPGQRLVCARIFETIGVANIAMGMLRANGIPCILDNEMIANVFAIPIAEWDGIRLMVHECNLNEALALLGPDRYPED